MPVATFLAKADALRAKGPMALFSRDYGLLKTEATAAAAAYRERLKIERAQGRPSSCPPAKAPFASDDVLEQMRSYPAGVRDRITVADAMADLFRKRYPCAPR